MHIILDKVEIDWVWTDKDLWSFRALWNDGAGLETIAKKLYRSTLEVELLVLDQVELGNIKKRENGVIGY